MHPLAQIYKLDLESFYLCCSPPCVDGPLAAQWSPLKANAQPASHSYGPSPLLQPTGQLAAQAVMAMPPIDQVQLC
jgi:hypothetical protein